MPTSVHAGPATEWRPLRAPSGELLLPTEPARYIAVLHAQTYRWQPYKPASQQFRHGLRGRWQRFGGYAWENAEPAGGLAWCDAPVSADTPLPPVVSAGPADAVQLLRELVACEDESMPSERQQWAAWSARRIAIWRRVRALAAAPIAGAPALSHDD